MIDFDDLNDPLPDFGAGPSYVVPPAQRATATATLGKLPGFTPFNEKTHFEPCSKCNGTGQTRWGVCFKCQGKKGKSFKTDSATRAKQREGAAVRRAEKAAEKAQEARTWAAEHAAEVEWLNTAANRQEWLASQGKPTWDFPTSVREALHKYGSLTDGQLAAVQRFIVRDAARKAEREANKPAAAVIDVSRIEAAFAKARGAAADDGEGIKWLCLRLDTFKFSPAGPRSKNPGAIYVKQGDDYLGKVQDGKFTRSFSCDAVTEERIIAVAADPAAAAKAFGLRTGQCSCCGRELTNEESRKLGIGPVCMERYGW